MWRALRADRWRLSVAGDDIADLVRAGNAAKLIAVLGVVGFASYALHPYGWRADLIAALAVVAGVGAAALNGFVANEGRVRRWAGPVFAAWWTADVVVIAVAVGVTGSWQSPLIWLLLLPVTFFTLLLDGRTAGVLLAGVVAVPFVVGAVTGSTPPAGEAVLLLSVVAATAMQASHLSAVLRARTMEGREAAATSERRAQLLAATTRAARSLAGLEVETVACNVVEATTMMGFGAVAFFDVDREQERLTCKAQVGLRGDWVGRTLDLRESLTGQVAVHGESVAVVDRSTPVDAMHEFRDAGFRAVVAVPVKHADAVTAVLVVGSRRERALLDEELEAIETLAIHANVALEMARAFEREAMARRQLEELVQRQHDHLATLSHELRTPLTVVQGAGRLLHDRWDELDEDDRQGLVARLVWHSADLTRLVDRLERLDLLQRGDQPVQPQPILVEPLISTLTRAFSDNTEEHLLTSRARRGIRVFADPVLLELVLIELIDNAVRHTPSGSHVHVEAQVTDDGVQIAVTDDGPGVPQEDIESLAVLFRRTGHPDTRETRGLGIGLTLVKQILELHDTRPQVTNGDRGLTVTFSLPLDGIDDQDAGDHVLLLGDLIATRRPVAGPLRS